MSDMDVKFSQGVKRPDSGVFEEAYLGAELDFQDIKPPDRQKPKDFEETMGGDNGFTEFIEKLNPVSKNLYSVYLSNATRSDWTSDDTGCPLDTADEKDEVSSTISELTDLSGHSEQSGRTEDPRCYRKSWIQKQMSRGANPRIILNQMGIDYTKVHAVDDAALWEYIMNLSRWKHRKLKLIRSHCLSDVVQIIRHSKKILVLTGAGVSVSCGIPDFRSENGLYARLGQDYPDLPNAEAMFDIHFFAKNPRPFFKFARELYPGQYTPSPCHRFIRQLEKENKLLRNYTQNIDSLELAAGIENVVHCHGSFATASCTRCKYQVMAEDIREVIFEQRIPMCPKCNDKPSLSLKDIEPNENCFGLVASGIMKPDIVFFGENLSSTYHGAIAYDKYECDLLIVIGSSLKVRPVSHMPASIPRHVPKILINKESQKTDNHFDMELLGDADVIINQLCHLLGGSFKEEVCFSDVILEETPELLISRYPDYDDSWEKSQESYNEISHDSVNSPIVSSESQDSLAIIVDSTNHNVGPSNMCMSPFHAGHMPGNVEGGFSPLRVSPKRKLDDAEVPSPKKMNREERPDIEKNLENVLDIPLGAGLQDEKEENIANGGCCDLESKDEQSTDCHVVPKTDAETKDEEKKNFEFGNSVGSAINEQINDLHERPLWAQRPKVNLASALPENTYLMFKRGGMCIFPGAEFYSEVDNCGHYLMHPDSSDSDSDSNSGDGDETYPDTDLSENADTENGKTE